MSLNPAQQQVDSQPVDPSDKPPRLRHRIPLSLQIFLGILGVLGAVTVTISVSAYRERQAVSQLNRWGAYLLLIKTQVTDDGLARLARLDNLERIDLADRWVTDSGLEHLASLRRLKYVSVKGAKVTHEGARKLNLALPALQIAGLPKQ